MRDALDAHLSQYRKWDMMSCCF